MIVSAKLILSILIPDISSLRRSWQNTIAAKGAADGDYQFHFGRTSSRRPAAQAGKMAAIGLYVHSLVKPRIEATRL